MSAPLVSPRERVGGRPRGTLGPLARQMLDAIATDGNTALELAQALQISVRAARYTCCRLEAAGLLRDGGRVPVAGARRPAIRYMRPDPRLPGISLPAGFFTA